MEREQRQVVEGSVLEDLSQEATSLLVRVPAPIVPHRPVALSRPGSGPNHRLHLVQMQRQAGRKPARKRERRKRSGGKQRSSKRGEKSSKRKDKS
jgi:hypothetical protein